MNTAKIDVNATPSSNSNPQKPVSHCIFVLEEVKSSQQEVTQKHADVINKLSSIKTFITWTGAVIGISVAIIGTLVYDKYSKVDKLIESSAQYQAQISAMQEKTADIKNDVDGMKNKLDSIDDKISKITIEQTKNHYALLDAIEKHK